MAGDVKYDEQLAIHIEELFINRIVPENFITYIHKYDKSVLTVDDVSRVRKKLESDIAKDVNIYLLHLMMRYKNWFECILKVCGDPELKQEWLVPEFQKIKRELDEKLGRTPDETQVKQVFLPVMQDRREEESVIGRGLEASNQAEQDLNKAIDSMNSLTLSADREEWYMDKGYGHCNVCEIALTSEEHKESHISGSKHKKKASKWRSGRDSLDTSTDQADCLGSNRMLEGGATGVDPGGEDVADDVGGKEGTDTSYDMNSSTLSPERKEWYMDKGRGRCNVCEIELTSEQHKESHIKGLKHFKKASKWRSGGDSLDTSTDQADCLDSDGEDVADKTGEKEGADTSYGMNSSTLSPERKEWYMDKGRGRCNVCEIELTSEQHKDSHINGGKHLKKASTWNQGLDPLDTSTDEDRKPAGASAVADLGDSNHYVLNDNGTGQCFVCNVAFTSRQNAEQHLTGKNHLKKVQAQKSK